MASGDVNYWAGAASGSASWNTPGNWSLGTVPVTGEHVRLRNSAALIDTGLAQSAVTLASFVQEPTFTGAVGGASTALAISMTLWRLEGGITRFNVDFGTNAFTGTVLGAGGSADTNLKPVRVKGVHASNVLNVLDGDVGVAMNTPADTATLGDINVEGGTVEISRGVTYTNLNNKGGDVIAHIGGTTLTSRDGTTTTRDTGTFTTVTAIGGQLYLNHRPAAGNMVGTLNAHGAEVHFEQNPSAGTIGTTNLRAGRVSMFSPTQITFTAIAMDLGENTSLSLSSAA
jgi:hypothetical protein